MTEDLYQQAKADFARAKARAEETAAEAERAQADLAGMQRVLDWFEEHRPAGHATVPAVALPELPPSGAVLAMNLSDLVYRAVQQLGGSAKNGDIREHLLRQGHDYTPLQIRGSTKYLAQKGRLVSGGYGIWCLPPRESAVPFEPDRVPVMNGAGRVPMA